jgi:hypothetical protein
MSHAIETLDGYTRASAPTSLDGRQQVIWTNGLNAAAASAAAALFKIGLSCREGLI